MIEIQNITLAYGQETVIRDFSLSIEAGQKIAIRGSSGSGKSSILRSLLGFVRPRQGRIVIDGTELNRHTVWPLRGRMGYVPQEADLGDARVGALVERPFSFRANAALRGNLRRLPEMLERFGLSQAILAKEMPALSGGEKQRIALIMTLLLDRPILLLDEISSALDAQSTETVVNLLAGSSQTVVLVSHDLRLAGVCDKVIDVPSYKESTAS
ncbi:MAG: amino acid ABC transporter ATP-binding protein [Phycisphaerae bacterium]|nr:amino acid ABC transporter ATP-binding protein [Phycisphaerae bacterium]